MNQQVSKGEFDRRVKLLEQKVQSSTNDLINRLQAESEAFIEQLKNTQLDVNSLREQVEEIGFDEQKLDDLISSYNNFKANTLRINDVFDTDGQFDGTKIRPLSIETAALSVGQRSQQLSLSGIEFKLDPYSTSGGGILYWKSTSNNSTISSSNIAGIMFHYGYGTETDPKIYKIMEGQYPNTGQSWNTSKGYYIYAKIEKGSSTTAIYTEPTTVTKEYFDGYFEMLYYSNHTKVYNNTLPLFDSSADYYIYVNNKYEKITITDSNYRKNLVGLYKKVGDLYQLVLQDQPVYSSSATYCTKKDKILPKENSSSSTYNGEIVTFNNVATIVVTTDQFTYDGTNQTSGGTSDTGYFYIQLGYVSVELNKGTTNNAYYRKVDMTYGSTTINGRLITTGRIEGNNCSFDLDTGEISGVVSYGLTTAQLGSALNTIYGTATDAKNAFDNLEVGGRNLLRDSSCESNGNYWNFNNANVRVVSGYFAILGQSYECYARQDITDKLHNGQLSDYVITGTIAADSTVTKGTTNYYVACFIGSVLNNTPYYGEFVEFDIDGVKQNNSAIDLNDIKGKNCKFTYKLKFDGNATDIYLYFYGRDFYNGNIYIKNIKLERGNKATDWSPAPEDMEEGGWVSKSKVLYYRNTSNSTPSIPTLDSSTQTIVYTKSGITWTDDINSLAPNKNNTTNFWIYKCQISYKEKNSKVKDFSCTNAVYDDAMTTNLIAMQGSTTIAGGLILSSKIIVKDENNANNCAVLNGTDEYAFYAGNQSHDSAPVWIKRNGTARFQNLFFNGSVIANKETNPEFGIHTTSISPSFNKEYKNTQINTNTSFNMSLYPVNKDVYNGIVTLEDYGPFSLTEVNAGYLSFNVEFDYEIIISSGKANKNGTIGFYLKYGPNRIALDVSGNPSFTPATSAGSIFGHCSQSGIKFTGLTGGNYEYILQFLLSENGNISNVSLRVFNIRISCQNTIPNLNYGFHIYTNGIIFYKNDSNYFILYDSGSSGLKCLNSLGF